MDTAAEIAGLICLVVAGFLTHPVAGFVVLGAALLLVGYRLEVARAEQAAAAGDEGGA